MRHRSQLRKVGRGEPWKRDLKKGKKCRKATVVSESLGVTDSKNIVLPAVKA